jgi:arylsulfatase A
MVRKLFEVVLAAAVLCAGFVRAAERPNIVVILSDDLGYGDPACFGNPVIQTPNLDRLADEGLKLTHCYAAAANCSPARTGLLTGRTPYRVGIYSAIPMLSPMHLPSAEVTIATLLRDAGYATAMTGKWHLAGMFNLAGQPQPHDHGFQHWFAVQNNALPNHRNPYNFVRNGIPCGRIKGHAGLIVAAEAVEWLKQGRDRDKPFFLYVAFNEPHEPIATDERFLARYREAYPDDPSRAAYYGNVTQLDHAVGMVLGALDAEGLAESTLVFFTSDNGPARSRYHDAGSTGGLREFKGHLYEGGIRVPGIVRWPGRVKPGSVSEDPVSGVDWLPTLCEVAGIPVPEDRVLDGVSVLPVLEGGAARRSKPLYWQFLRFNPHVAIRHGPWKLLASLDGPEPTKSLLTEVNLNLIQQAGLKDFELYNLEDDPEESRDLAALEPGKLAELTLLMREFHDSVRREAPGWPLWEDPGYESARIEWPNYQVKGKEPRPRKPGPK